MNNNMIFNNELGNEIHMQVSRDERGVHVYASGPTSQVGHTWTPVEAKALRDLLSLALDTRNKMIKQFKK